MLWRTKYVPLLLLSMLAFAFAGCDEAEPDPDPVPPNFSFVELSGGVAGAFQGNAYFSVEGGAFLLYFFDGAATELDTARSEFVALSLQGGPPQPGEYDIRLPGHAEARVYAGYARKTPNDLKVAGETGALTIRTASAELVSGEFTFSGTAYVPDKTGRGSITGSFQARRSTAPLPPYPFAFPGPGD